MKTRDFINISKTTKIMKTGGTMNFLKRAGAILMLVAVFASSCNKYADDFKQINTKLDALAAQVAGVTQLTTDNAALKAQITALQTAVAALPTTASVTALQTSLAGVTTTINTINTNLNNLATSFATTGATKADVTAVITSLTTQLATLQAQLTADNGAQTTALTAAISSLQTSINTLQTGLDSLTGTAATQASVAALQTQLAAAQVSLNTLLANSNMYNGDVTITSGPELTFWAKKIAQLGMINGNLTINTTLLANNLDSVNYVVKNISAVIGTQGAVKNSVTVTSTSTTTVLDLSHLVSVAGDYTVTGVVINDSNLSSVGGNVLLNYDGSYTYPNLTTVTGNLTLTAVAKTSTKSGTTSISLPNVVVNGSVFDGVNVAGVLSYPVATSIALSGGVTSLTAAKATSIVLGSTAYPSGLTVQAPTAAAVVNLSAATSAAGAVSVTTGNGGSVLFANLASAAGGVTVNTGTSGTVDFTALVTAAGGVNLTGPATVTFPALGSGAVTSDATTVSMAMHNAAIAPVLSKVTTLTMGAIANPFTLANYPTLVTANITGKTITTNPMPSGAMGSLAATSANTALTTVSAAGTLEVLSLSDCSALTSLTTAGVINTFNLNNCDALVGATLAHTHYVGGTGSVVSVTGNLKLASLTTSTDMMASLTVTGNAALASANFASYVTKTVSGNPTITINTNKLAFTYTNAQAATITTPYVETVITSAALSSLKAYVALYSAPVLSLNLDYIGSTATTLSSKMSADSSHTPAFAAPATGITTKAELALVQ